MTVHQLRDSLEYSHSQADAPYWQEVYRLAFPDAVSTVDLRHDGWHQKAGRDRAVILSTGRSVFIDEKVRRETWDDIAIEVWSVYPKAGSRPWPPRDGAIPGWGAKPLDCDYLAYAFESSQTCHLFPFLGVRAAWEKHGAMWRQKATLKEDGFRWIEADNDRWWSVSIAVPIVTLRQCIEDSLTVTWEGGD
jgi:hypothetical protein